MSLKSRSTVIALITQSVVGTFVDPAANLMPVSNLSENVSSVTIANPEYTGSVNQNGDEVAGRNVSYTFDVNLRPPGGADVPAAGAYLPGILLRNAKMSEVRTTTAIPAAPEALSAGSTTGFTGGAGVTGTLNLYKGKLVRLLGVSTGLAGLCAIRTNDASKVFTLSETLAGSASGNYQIPKQLSYEASIDSSSPLPISLKVWIDGLRYDLVDSQVTSLALAVPTTTRDSAAIPVMRVTITGTLYGTADEATPSIPALGTTPKFRDGKQFLALKAVGGSGFDLNLGLQTAAAPNPNMATGAEADELVSKQATLTPNLLGYLKAQFDTLAMADAQAQHPFYAAWGSGSGGIVTVHVPDARFSHAGRDIGGQHVMQSPQLFIDVFTQNVVISFPYW